MPKRTPCRTESGGRISRGTGGLERGRSWDSQIRHGWAGGKGIREDNKTGRSLATGLCMGKAMEGTERKDVMNGLVRKEGKI